jgi:hypothetical protein
MNVLKLYIFFYILSDEAMTTATRNNQVIATPLSTEMAKVIKMRETLIVLSFY